MKAVRAHEIGGPEVLKYEDVADPVPEAGQALVGKTLLLVTLCVRIYSPTNFSKTS